MENTTYIYGDGSYLVDDKKCGYCFMFFQHGLENQVTFIFGKCTASSSTEAELIAVIKTLEYFKNLNEQKDDNKYVLGIDELNIFKFITKKIYQEFDINGWNYSDGKPRKKNTRLWKKMVGLYESFPKGSLKLKKVQSKVNQYNKQVDKIARFIVNKELEDEECSYIVTNACDYKSIILGEVNPSKIIMNECGVIVGKEVNLNLTKKIDWEALILKDKVKLISVDEVEVIEGIHLKAEAIDFHGMLWRFKEDNSIIKPIAVRRKMGNSDGYYLVAGVTRLFACKIVGIKTIPAILTDLGHTDFIKEHGI